MGFFCGFDEESLFVHPAALTMGMISKEMNSGTVKLLYSSPGESTPDRFGKNTFQYCSITSS